MKALVLKSECEGLNKTIKLFRKKRSFAEEQYCFYFLEICAISLAVSRFAGALSFAYFQLNAGRYAYSIKQRYWKARDPLPRCCTWEDTGDAMNYKRDEKWIERGSAGVAFYNTTNGNSFRIKRAKPSALEVHSRNVGDFRVIKLYSTRIEK